MRKKERQQIYELWIVIYYKCHTWTCIMRYKLVWCDMNWSQEQIIDLFIITSHIWIIWTDRWTVYKNHTWNCITIMWTDYKKGPSINRASTLSTERPGKSRVYCILIEITSDQFQDQPTMRTRSVESARFLCGIKLGPTAKTTAPKGQHGN